MMEEGMTVMKSTLDRLVDEKVIVELWRFVDDAPEVLVLYQKRPQKLS